MSTRLVDVVAAATQLSVGDAKRASAGVRYLRHTHFHAAAFRLPPSLPQRLSVRHDSAYQTVTAYARRQLRICGSRWFDSVLPYAMRIVQREFSLVTFCHFSGLHPVPTGA